VAAQCRVDEKTHETRRVMTAAKIIIFIRIAGTIGWSGPL
jgi:hypothetical protein